MYKGILGYKVFSGTKSELYEEIINRRKVNIISGNSEILYKGFKDRNLNRIYKDKDSLIIADGAGTILASKILGDPIVKKIAGIDFMEYIIKKSTEENLNIYLLGAEEETVKGCFNNLNNKYKAINIVGFHHGYFDINNCDELINEINLLKTNILFVAMGSPKQEIFIDKYMDVLNCNITMGVGGSFDIFAGNLKRAPKVFIKLNLEWLYRIIKEPKRVLRLKSIPLFLTVAINEKRKKG